MQSAEIDLKAKTVTVTMKKGALDRKVVAKAFEGTKFKVSSFSLVMKAPAPKKPVKPVTKKKS